MVLGGLLGPKRDKFHFELSLHSLAPFPELPGKGWAGSCFIHAGRGGALVHWIQTPARTCCWLLQRTAPSPSPGTGARSGMAWLATQRTRPTATGPLCLCQGARALACRAAEPVRALMCAHTSKRRFLRWCGQDMPLTFMHASLASCCGHARHSAPKTAVSA